jgi:hypothetical protein
VLEEGGNAEEEIIWELELLFDIIGWLVEVFE